MTTREQILTVLEGGVPGKTPYYYRKWLLPVYHEMVENLPGKRVMMHFDSELCQRFRSFFQDLTV